MTRSKKKLLKPRKGCNKPVVKSDFLCFYDKFVKSPNLKDLKNGKKFVKRFGKGLSESDASLLKINRFWNRAAPFYLTTSSPKRFDVELLLLKQYASLQPADKIVSIGAGPAVLEAFIAKEIVTKGQVTCIDSSLKFVRIARKIRNKVGLKNMRVSAGSATGLKLSNSSQDKVLMMQTILPNTIHWKPVLNEAFRVIKKTASARLVLTFALESKSGLEKIKSSLFKNGFSSEITASYGKSGSLTAFAIIAGVRPCFWN